MPTSPEGAISRVLQLISIARPRSILDLGCGFGEYGFLIRLHMEDTRVWPTHWSQPERAKWAMRIDGVELHEPYIGSVHHTMYDRVIIGDALSEVERLGRYDVVFMGNLIEHLTKEAGRQLLDAAYERTDVALILVTPFGFAPFDAAEENVGQRHRSGWYPSDFACYRRAFSFVEDLSSRYPRLVVVIAKEAKITRELERRTSCVRNLVRHLALDLLGNDLGTKLYLRLRGAFRHSR